MERQEAGGFQALGRQSRPWHKEEGTITPQFDMTVLNDLGRFHLAIGTIDRPPQIGDKGIDLKTPTESEANAR